MRKLAQGLALTTTSVFTFIVLLAAVSNLFASGDNIVTALRSFSWTVLGPHFIVVSFGAIAVSLFLFRLRRTKAPLIVGAAAVIALVSSLVIVTRIAVAVRAAGGKINPVTALRLSVHLQRPNVIESYAFVDNRSLDAYVYKPANSRARAPLMLFIHGGGWTSGSVKEFVDARWYADHGWLVVSADYRLAKANSATWDKAPADVGCALSWAALNAERFGGDPKRITVFGMSAGGNLALNLAWAAALDRAPTTCPSLGKVPKPQAVVADYTVANVLYTYQHGKGESFQDPRHFIEMYLGGNSSTVP